MYWCILIDWISQSAMALYIYRVGGLVPQEIILQDLNLWKSLVVLGLCLDRSDRSDLPVRPVGSCRISYIDKDRSDRLERPVRPVGLVCCQFWSSTHIDLFWSGQLNVMSKLTQICWPHPWIMSKAASDKRWLLKSTLLFNMRQQLMVTYRWESQYNTAIRCKGLERDLPR